ncbi:MAG: imidazolonepropionase, partial [Phycisphaerae bacterium]
MAEKILIDEIGALAVVPAGPLHGGAMREYDVLRDAAVLLEGGVIRWFGAAKDAPRADARVESVDGRLVTPGLIDAHTHIPFAGDRAAEFARRVAGESYLSIMESGGGIRVTTSAVRAESVESLVSLNAPRLARMIRHGVTTVECKSGYGLTRDDERKQLRATQSLQKLTPLELVPTYMGVHAVPKEFDGRADEFVDEMTDPVFLAEIRREGLAEFFDVFCDRGAFSVDQARRALSRAREAGFELKMHADELAQIGASALAGEMQAISADHLELIDDAGVAALKAAGTIAMVLPGTSFFLGIEHCNARRLIEAGLAVGLATDYNPGSAHIESLPYVMNIACCQLRMTPKEVLAACTSNAAAALCREKQSGAIAAGYQADLAVWNVESLDEWFYKPGR